MRPGGGAQRPFVPPGRKPLAPLAAVAGAAEGAAACVPSAPAPRATPAAPPAAPAPPRPTGFAPPRAANGAGFAPPRPVAGAAGIARPSAAAPSASADAALPDEYYAVCYCKRSNKVQRQHKGFAVRSHRTHLCPLRLRLVAPFADALTFPSYDLAERCTLARRMACCRFAARPR